MKNEKKNKKIPKRKKTLFEKIINGILYFFLGLFVLFAILFGISQTHTFREYLREEIISNVNGSINGELHIGELDGTILTSLILRDVILESEKDTILNCKKIEVLVSPHKLMFDIIYIRKLEITDGSINLIKYENDIMNIAALTAMDESDTTSQEAATDTSDGKPFPYVIQLKDVLFSSVDFSMQRYDKLESTETYTELNFDDLRLDNIEMEVTGFTGFTKNDYALSLKKLAFESNMEGFRNTEIAGLFRLRENNVSIESFLLKNDFSNIIFNIFVNDFNIFEGITLEALKEANIRLGLNALQFNFDNLSTFLEATSFLKGSISAKLFVEGTLDELKINELLIDYQNTSLRGSGMVRDLLKPGKLYISTIFTNSVIKQTDANELLPSFGIPSYKNLPLVKIDTLKYEGYPNDFTSRIKARIGEGAFDVLASMDFTGKEMEYDIELSSQNLNVTPVSSYPMLLNIQRLKVTGEAVDPEKMKTSLSLAADRSTIGGLYYNQISLTTDANDGNISIDALLKTDEQMVNLDTDFYLKGAFAPSYDLYLQLDGINLSQFLDDPELESNINLIVTGKGRNFDYERISGNFAFDIKNSRFGGYDINDINMDVSILAGKNNKKRVNIDSELFEMDVFGEYSYLALADVVTKESMIFVDNLLTKVETYTPFQENEFAPDGSGNVDFIGGSNNALVFASEKFLDVDYKFVLKDLSPLKIFLGENDLSVKGVSTGTVKNDSTGFSLTMDSHIDSLSFGKPDSSFLLKHSQMNIQLNHPLEKTTFDDLKLSLITDIESFQLNESNEEKIIADASFNGQLRNSLFECTFSSTIMKDIFADSKLHLDLTSESIEIAFDSLSVAYFGYRLNNQEPFRIAFNEDDMRIHNFNLHHGLAEATINGYISDTKDHRMQLQLINFDLMEIQQTMLGITDTSLIDAKLSMNGIITGRFEEPVINITMSADSVNYNNVYFGILESTLSYDSLLLTPDISFVSMNDPDKKICSIYGNVPVNLSFENIEQRFSDIEPINITFEADSFNLGLVNNIIPNITDIDGKLFSEMNIYGYYPDLATSGNLQIKNTRFRALDNNLRYGTNIDISLNQDTLSLNSFVLQNVGELPRRGELRGSGQLILDGFTLLSSDVSIEGNLALLSSRSQAASPSLFGDLFVETERPIRFRSYGNVQNLSASIIVNNADLTFMQSQSAYTAGGDKFIYRYIDERVPDHTIVETDSSGGNGITISNNGNGRDNANFNYDVSISIEDEALMTFILSKELNQILVARLAGDVRYMMKNGQQNVQGELQVLEDSRLELFLKNFDAEGSIRFESDVANPNLDITATYSSYVTVSNDDGNDVEELVAVKIKLNGPLNQLTENLNENEDNIALYVGEQNIENDNPASQYDKADAVWFIITGNMRDNTADVTNDAVGSTGYSMAGSLLGGLLNNYLGDIVKSVELRKSGASTNTRFNLSGRFSKIRYSIGGSTNVFQDVSNANIKLEYPIIRNLLLRLERKEATREGNDQAEMINELGLKYRFQF